MSKLALISGVSAPRYCIAADSNPMSVGKGGSASALLTAMDNGVFDMKAKFLSVLAVVAALATPASANSERPYLGENKPLNDTLYAILVADEIRKQCDSISGRVLKGIGMLWGIVQDAKELGYTDDEINAYRNSEEAKAVLRARGDAMMAEKNVTYDDPQTFCQWGRDEIANDTLIGSLLRAK